jgi:PAS domain S-box-containing protein
MGRNPSVDMQVAIQDLQDQLAVREAELKRTREELSRVQVQLAQEIAEREQTEKTLRESEERFRLLVEHSHDAVYSITPDGIVTYVSPGFSHYGYLPKEVISKHFIGFVAPEQRQQVMESFETGTSAGTSYPTAFQWLRKDGSRVWVEVVGNTIFDDSGQPVQQIGVMRDISERKAQEERNQSLLLLLETADAECFVKDRHGIYQYVNCAFERQFGVKREDVIGRDDAYIFGEEAAAMLRDNDQRIMASGKTETIEESGHLEGRGPVVYLTSKTPMIDENGNVIGICGVGVDITRQKALVEELRESRARYRDLVERISDAIYTVDTQGIIRYVSPAIEPILGYRTEQMVGRSFAAFLVPEDLIRGQGRFQRLLAGEYLDPREYRFVTSTGEIRWLRIASQPILDGEQTSGVRGVLSDVTDRVRAERQHRLAAAAAERERLTRDLHDSVTQTLFSMAAIAEVLPDMWERDPSRSRTGLQDLQDQTQRALAEMRSLLLARRPEDLGAQDLRDLIHELSDATEARTQTTITTTVMGNYRLPAEVKLAFYRIAQEALNNVAKHASASRAIIRLQDTDTGITLCISDNGCGFEPAHVGPQHLGLDIMRERARVAGAVLSVASQPGGGTEISVTWPSPSDPAAEEDQQ